MAVGNSRRDADATSTPQENAASTGATPRQPCTRRTLRRRVARTADVALATPTAHARASQFHRLNPRRDRPRKASPWPLIRSGCGMET